MPDRNFTFSRILSFILHPLIIPALATLALLNRPDIYPIVLPDNLKIWYLSVVVVFTLVLPLAGVLILLKLNILSTIEMKIRSERTTPLVLSAISYISLLFIIKPAGIPPILLYILYSATITLLSGLLINLVYKISLHTLGWSGITCMLTGLSMQSGLSFLSLIIVAILLSGIAGYARLKQNAHNQAQVYSGYVAGAGIIILFFLFA